MRADHDYDGAIIVVEIRPDTIVLVHPTNDEYASLPGDPCDPAETVEQGAVRIVHDMTGLVVALDREFVTFLQPGTPTGTMRAHGFIAQPVGGELMSNGPAGLVAAYPVDSLPPIVPVRVAIQRVLATYLAGRG